jgi:hypothetical protein
VEVSVEPAQVRTLSHSVRGRIISDQGDKALSGWFNGFTRTKTGNYIGEFFLAKKASDVVISARINIFKSDRTTQPGCPWTWGIQIIDGPRRMVMEKPAYSNLYFAGPHEAAISVRDDLRGGGYAPTQPERSSLITALVKEHAITERVQAAEDRSFVRGPKRTRIIDT